MNGYGFSTACIYVFGAEGPFIGIHLLHIPPAVYGLFALTPCFGTLLGGLIVARLSTINPAHIIKCAFCLELIASIVMFFLFFFHHISLVTLLIPMGLFCIGHPMIAATGISLAMQQTSDKSNGSAIANFVSISVPVLMTLLLTVIHSQQAIVLPIIFLIAMMLMAGYILWCTQ